MRIRQILNNVVAVAKKLIQDILYKESNMEDVFEEHYFLELYYLYPNVSSESFAAKSFNPQTKIDQYVMEKYGLDFFQLCNKLRIEYFLSKHSIDVSENNLDSFSLKGTGFTNMDEFKNAFNRYASRPKNIEVDLKKV